MLIPLFSLVAMAIIVTLCLALGGPTAPPPMASINDPFKSVDFSDLPAVATYRGADGQVLAYREYVPPGAPRGSVTLIHGSSASSNSMHPMAKALSAAGYKVFAIDVRGHGQSGHRGHIDYVGQLESDLAAFVHAVQPPQPSTLAGFSAGGGFALRFASSEHGLLFSSYLMLSPFLSQDAENQRPNSGGWVNVGIPRVVALTMLNSVGVSVFNSLPVTAFALNEQSRAILTPQYDFNLAMNFRPERDYMANIRRVSRPVAALVGQSDEAFFPEKLEPIFRAAGKNWPVELLPNVGHIALTLEPPAISAVVRHVRQLHAA
ncbi:MAG: alpha/beta hydrolase [Gallionellaceae bacterium]|nr:MAG: alpha/beta hydrolase [Gallionellaceae bacterium]